MKNQRKTSDFHLNTLLHSLCAALIRSGSSHMTGALTAPLPAVWLPPRSCEESRGDCCYGEGCSSQQLNREQILGDSALSKSTLIVLCQRLVQ